MYPAALEPGGAERQLTLLAAHLPADRFDVSFVVLLGMTALAQQAAAQGAALHVLDAPNRRSAPLPVYAARAARQAAAYVGVCRRERFDIVDAWLYLGYSLAALTRPLSRVPVLIAGRRSLGGYKAGFGPVERAVDAAARRAADIIVANSQAVADDTVRREGIDPSRIRVIRNGVVIPPEPTAASQRRARAMMGVDDDGAVIGCVGGFRPGKGQARVIEVMGVVNRAHPDAWLVFVGDGPERAAAEREAARSGLRRVRFLGTVPDARPLYDGFDVVVSASDAEGLPNVVLEAAAAGRPTAATAAGGTTEVIIDGRTGLLVPCGETEALAAAVIRLLSDRDLASELGGRAREHVMRAFGVERFVAETAALYEELHANHDH
jgi:glycosyltransferase involved in cell wall biosynthesis